MGGKAAFLGPKLGFSGTMIIVTIYSPYEPPHISFLIVCRAVELFCGLGPGQLRSADSAAAFDGLNPPPRIDPAAAT